MSANRETALIEQLLGHPLHPDAHASLPGDDAVEIPGGSLVSVDTMIEGVHFDHRLSAEDVGWKLVAVNASDIGACGRRPEWALLSISVPREDTAWTSAFAKGLHQALARWNISLRGGDTTRSSGPKMLSMTVGSACEGPIVARTGAVVGDDIWVTGALGRSAAGFVHSTRLGLQWLRRPEPPVFFGAALGESSLPTAMMDLSDGLAQDLPRLCQASGVGAHVECAKLPRDGAIRGISTDEVPALLTGFGEDYELLFTASSSPKTRQMLSALAETHHTQITRVGTCLPASSGVTLDGGHWPKALFQHF